jgi:hypothetical protein
VLDRLYALLHARLNDELYWVRLGRLVVELQQDLRKGRTQGLPTRDAEVLSDQQIEVVLGELQAALRSADREPSPGALSTLLPGRSAGLGACVALLAAILSAGCNPRASESPPAQDAPGISADPTQGATTDASAELRSDALVQLFRDGSPDDIAAILEAMVDGGVHAVVDASARESGARPVVGGSTPPPRPKPTVQPVPRYKGVTF